MFFVNIILLFLLFVSICIYKYVFPKKKINLFFLLLAISVVAIVSIFRTGAYESGDFNIHVRRSMEFYKVLMEGNLIPSWAGDFNATYGYPLFAFNYILPYYITSFFHFIGFSFINSMKLLLSLSFIFSGIFMYLFSKNLFKKSLPAFGASIFYLFAPYHLISLNFKVTIGEVLSYTFIPLVFYFMNKYLDTKKITYSILSGLSLSLVILSHIFIAIFLIPIFFIYTCFHSKNIVRGATHSAFAIILSLTIALFQWTAPLIYKPFLFTTVYPPGSAYFPTLIDLLYSPWRFGLLFQGPKGELSFLIGYVQIIVIIVALFYLITKKNIGRYKNDFIFWLLIIFATIFLITPYSKFIWDHVQILAEAGSHRLLILMGFFTSIVAGFLFLIFSKNKLLIYTFIFLTVATTILNWGQRTMLPQVDDNVLRRDLPLSATWGDGHFYANSKWVDPKHPWFLVIPSSSISITRGEGKVLSETHTSVLHAYKVTSATSLTITENTLYFPGWKATFNNKHVDLKPSKSGLIYFNLPQGNGTLILSYHDLPLFMISKLISFIAILLTFIYLMCVFIRHFLLRPKT
jgi:hypothetical protein